MNPNHTLNYIYNKYSIVSDEKMPIEIPNAGRADLARLLNELNFEVGAEIGVANGVYSKQLCRANPRMKFYGIDAWETYGNYGDYSAETLALYYDEVKKYFASFPNYEIIKESSMDAVNRFEDNSLDFVYIDANHTEPFITQDIAEWSKKVRPGGIVSGHDYIKGIKAENGTRFFDVIKVTHKYTKANSINPWFVLGLGNRLPGLVKDISRSWFWVKM